MSANDRPCVKTHTSAKCRKHNSQARHRTSRVQYDLTLRDAIARRYFYVWRDRWSFRTAKTHQRHRATSIGPSYPLRCSYLSPGRAMRRREFIAALGGAAALPLGARAQQGMPVVGFLSSRSPGESADVVAAFVDGLRGVGYVAGQNVVVEYRWAEGEAARLPALAAEFVRRPV